MTVPNLLLIFLSANLVAALSFSARAGYTLVVEPNGSTSGYDRAKTATILLLSLTWVLATSFFLTILF